jgi:DNA-binding Xre family transcriptional regulator
MIEIRLKEVTEAKGHKLNYLVLHSGVSIGTVRNYWHNKAGRVDLDVLNRFCELLDVEPGDLLVRLPALDDLTNRPIDRFGNPPYGESPKR